MNEWLLPRSTATSDLPEGASDEALVDMQRDALAAPVADPLWLLARQWQTGAFQATDGGSALHTEIRWSSGAIRMAGETIDGPLEPVLEPEGSPLDRELDFARRARLMTELQRMLRDGGVSSTVCVALRKAWLAAYPFEIGRGPARAHALASRLPDPGPMITAISRAMASHDAEFLAGLSGTQDLDSGTRALVERVLREWFAWARAVTSAPEDAPVGRASRTPPAWNSERLAYDVRCSVAFPGGSLVLANGDYDGTGLDWFTFDRSALDVSNPELAQSQTAEVRPTRVSYAGMPRPRWWEIEDGDVNLDALREDDDPARRALAAFSHSYSNDWFLCPLVLKPGWVRVDALRVRDTFGRQTDIRPIAELDGDVGPFRLWDLSRPEGGVDTAAGLRLAWPVSPPILEGPILEEVLLARDEFANLAWAVEKRTQDAFGSTVDRYRRWMELRRQESDVESTGTSHYRLGTQLPDFWYPLMSTGAARDEVLQVAGVPPEAVGVSDDGVRGILLEHDDATRLSTSIVTRQGRRVLRRKRLVLSRDGVKMWCARVSSPGEGEASSGLRFDVFASHESTSNAPSEEWDGRTTIDATSLRPRTQLSLRGIKDGFASAEPWTGQLTPGAYELHHGTGVGYGVAPFTVLPDGMIACSIAHSSMIEWDDRHATLRVHGVELLLDAKALIPKRAIGLGGFAGGSLTSGGTPEPLRLLSGRHSISYGTGVGYGVVVFDVFADGKVDVVDKPAGVHWLAGRRTLKLEGVEVTFDLRGLAPARAMSLGGGIGGALMSGTLIEPMRFLPGRHSIHYGTGGGYGVVNFEVLTNGAIAVLDSPKGVGAENGVLTIEGADVTIDMKGLLPARVMSLGGGIGGELMSGTATEPMRLLPGRHSVFYWTGVAYGVVNFEVLANGEIAVLDNPKGVGAENGVMTIEGADVTIDMKGLVPARVMSLGGGIGGALMSGTATEPMRLLPGRHSVFYWTGVAYGVVNFEVLANGSIELIERAKGVDAEDGTLTLEGAEVIFEVKDLLPRGEVSLGGGIGGTFFSDTTQTLHLLPGRHAVSYSTGGGMRSFVFELTADGVLEYSDELKGELEGIGTKKLSIHRNPEAQ